MVRSSVAAATAAGSVSKAALPSTFTDGLPLPKMFVFDLDYTLWPFWVDTHVTPPLRSVPGNDQVVQDAHRENLAFYPDVPGILRALQSKNILVGAASRTHAPDLARKMLSLLHVPPSSVLPNAPNDETGTETGKGGANTEDASPAIGLFDHMEIYPGSKTTHFRHLHKKSGLPYAEMLFFDDESRNRNVEELGVVMQLVRTGTTRNEIDAGVQSWRKRNGRTKKESSA